MRTGVRLNIGIMGTKQLFGTVDGQSFSHIHMLTTTIVALTRITLSILVGQNTTLSLHHTGAGIVF